MRQPALLGGLTRLNLIGRPENQRLTRLVAEILFGHWHFLTAILQLEGDYRQTISLGAASVPGQQPGEVLVIPGQDAEIRRGQYVNLEFLVANGAGLVGATWYCAEKPGSLAGDRLVTLTSPTQVSVTDQGADLLVRVTLLEAQTEPLPAGRLYHELWVIDSLGRAVPAAEGVLTVQDSLRS